MLYAMCCTMMYYTITILWYAITILSHYTMIYYTITLYHDVLYYDILYHHYTITMIYYTITIPWYAITILWCATTMSHASHQDRSTSFTHTSYQHWSRNARARIARASWQKAVFSCSFVWRAWAMPSTLTGTDCLRASPSLCSIWWYRLMV